MVCLTGESVYVKKWRIRAKVLNPMEDNQANMDKRNMRFKEKAVVITGGGSGIGREICLGFAQEGAKVAIPDINLTAAQETRDIIEKNGGCAVALKADVSRGEDVRKVVQEVVEEFGGVHILVNNAGLQARTPFLKLSEEEWDRVVAVNLRGTFLCTRYIAPEMIKIGGGKVINISSNGGLIGFAAPAYTAAKGGVISLTRVLAGEFAPYRINVNAVCPGLTATPMNKEVRQTALGEILRLKIPWGRWGRPSDIAAMVMFLASDEADFITGSIITVDGGMSSFIDLGKEFRGFDQKST
jgi:NAD(P)-dependent dehydrogenase (short-subunit alcohol dehydrogenase family)